MICGQTCDGLYHFAFYLVNFGIPCGSHTQKLTKSTLALKLSVSAIITPGGLPHRTRKNNAQKHLTILHAISQSHSVGVLNVFRLSGYTKATNRLLYVATLLVCIYLCVNYFAKSSINLFRNMHKNQSSPQREGQLGV